MPVNDNVHTEPVFETRLVESREDGSFVVEQMLNGTPLSPRIEVGNLTELLEQLK